MMKNFKNKRAVILVIILAGLLVIAYKTIFVSPGDNVSTPANVNVPDVESVSSSPTPIGGAASSMSGTADTNILLSGDSDVESILRQMESINFDTNIIENQKFKSLKSIEVPLISLPVGRGNPFSPTSNSKVSSKN